MAQKERNQNPLVGDTVRLKFFVFNGGSLADPSAIQDVEIYKIGCAEATEANPLGRQLVTTVDSSSVVREDVGTYYVDLELTSPLFTQGQFQDEWNIVFESDTAAAKSSMHFTIYPNSWFTDSAPIIHDFSFGFRPNRIIKGTKKYLQISVVPQVPKGTDKQRYYENMVAGGTICFFMKQVCGECLPAEDDLRMVHDNVTITERDGCMGFFFLDTTELEIGEYEVWFQMSLGPNCFISDKEILQIYC